MDSVQSVAFSPDGKLLASASEDGTVKLWQLPEATLVKTLAEHFDSIESVAFSSDGKMLVLASGDELISLWQMPEATLAKNLIGHSDDVFSVALSPDDKLLASASEDYTVKLWQLPEGILIKTLTEHSEDVQSVAFSPDGKLLASASEDFTVNLWQMPEGILLNTLTGHTDSVESVAFSPDGKVLVSGSWDKTVRLWDLENNKFLAYLFDPAVNLDDAISYEVYHAETGRTITYTMPCGSAIPQGATCVCNCIGGTYKVPVPAKSPVVRQVPSTRTYCSCNTVCTCVPVCQAHNLLDQDSNVRVMAEEILLLMGKKELSYMQWAATDTLNPVLQKRLYEMINLVKKGTPPNPERWLSITQYEPYLNHEDTVVTIMAAQMIQQQILRQQVSFSAPLMKRVNEILRKADGMHWLKRISTKPGL
ncbi:MAG: WD40 repeat domain-containing protein [Saprospiraceae bacterium]